MKSIRRLFLERQGCVSYWLCLPAVGLLLGTAMAAQQGSDVRSRIDTTPCYTDILAGLPGVYDGALAWGDYDNDGDLDILLTGRASGATISRVYRNSGGPTPTFSDISANLTGVLTGSVAWADFNNDGYLDILLSGNTGNGGTITKVYMNSGGANPVFSELQVLLPGVLGAAAVADYDNDGDQDFALAGDFYPSAPISRIYRNNGGATPTFTDIQAGLPGVTGCMLSWGDYDKDGNLDLLLAGYNSPNYIARIFRNSGGANPTFTAAADAAGAINGSASWGDYDNDGDLDIVATGGQGPQAGAGVLNNNGEVPDPYLDYMLVGLSGVQKGTAAWGDHNNDGYLDVLMVGFNGLAPSAKVFQSSGGEFPTFTDVGAGLPGVGRGSLLLGSAAAWGDYDNDGRLDILLCGPMADGSLITRIYRNTCGASNTPPAAPTNLQMSVLGTQVTFTWDAATDAETPASGLSYNLRVGTAPGLADLFASNASPSTGYRRVVTLGNTNLRTSWEIEVPVETPIYWSVQAVDGAFAGSPFASESSVPQCFTNAGAGLPGVESGSVEWGDYDNDGDIDVLLTGTGEMGPIARVYQSSGGATPTFTDIGAGLPGVAAGNATWGDYDNDGDLDILLGGRLDPSTDIVRVFRSSGGANPTFTDIAAGLPGALLSSVAWGDYDNDDDLDILIWGFGTAAVYRNRGSSNPPFTLGASVPVSSISHGSAAFGDYNNDDLLDIVLSGYDYLTSHTFTAVYRNNGGADPSFTDIGAGLTSGSYSGYGSVAWGDYDNDGDLDILLTGTTGSLSGTLTAAAVVYRNNGAVTPRFTDIGAGLPGVSGGSAVWGDYDSDGHLDILFSGSHWGTGIPTTPIASVYRNSGGANPTFTDIVPFLRGVGGSSAAWGDYDNDGDLDILLTGSDSPSYISRLYRNVCSVPKPSPFTPPRGSVIAAGPNTPPSTPTGLYARIDGTMAQFSWNASTDGQTPSAGLSYNLRVGTSPGASDIVSPMTNATTGYRRLPALLGNMNLNTSFELVLPGPGTYYWSVQAVDGAAAGSPFAAEQIPVDVVESSGPVNGLWSAGPNPFSHATTIQFSQPMGGWVSLAIYDVSGRRVRTLVRESLHSGPFTRTWDGNDDAGRSVGSGIYFIRIKTADFEKTHKIVLMR